MIFRHYAATADAYADYAAMPRHALAHCYATLTLSSLSSSYVAAFMPHLRRAMLFARCLYRSFAAAAAAPARMLFYARFDGAARATHDMLIHDAIAERLI